MKIGAIPAHDLTLNQKARGLVQVWHSMVPEVGLMDSPGPHGDCVLLCFE